MVDASVTAANVAPVTTGNNRTRTSHGTAGATITAGQTLAKQTDGKWDPADVDVSDAGAGSAGAGVALCGAADTQPIEIATGGEYDPGFAATEGVIYVFSDTAGGIMPSADLESGDRVTILGVGLSNGNILMPPGGPFYSGATIPV